MGSDMGSDMGNDRFVHTGENLTGAAVTRLSSSPEPSWRGAPRDAAGAPESAASVRVLAPLSALPPMGLELPLVIERSEVHIWYVFSDEVRDPDLLAAYERMLAPEERVQWQRFVFERDRHQYLVTRALLRTVLSRYAPVPPAEWGFVRNTYGKPEISGPPGVFWPSFNLSHTRGLIACAVSASHRELGVDVEDTSRCSETVSIAEHFFSATEVRALRALPEAAQRERFFSYWTLKESYIKARGMGLSIPLEQFSLHLPGPRSAHDDQEQAPIRISFDPRLQDEPHSWQLVLLRASPRHFLALGARCRGMDLRLRAAHYVPAQRVWSQRPGHS